MARDWTREPYRKLFLRPSKEWQALPVLVRGVGDELLRLADDDGRIFVGDERTWIATLCRLLGAHPDERKIIARKLEILLARDNFVVRDGAYLVVRNLAEAHRRGGTPTGGRGGLDGSPVAERRPEIGHGRATGEPRHGHGSATAGTRPGHVSDPSPRNYSPDFAHTRASQAVNKGRQATPAREADAEHPISKLLLEYGVLAEEAPLAVAWSVIELGRLAQVDGDALEEVAHRALQATIRALSSAKGIEAGKIGSYLLSTVTSLLEPGGLEAEHEKRAPRSSVGPVTPAKTFRERDEDQARDARVSRFKLPGDEASNG